MSRSVVGYVRWMRTYVGIYVLAVEIVIVEGGEVE